MNMQIMDRRDFLRLAGAGFGALVFSLPGHMAQAGWDSVVSGFCGLSTTLFWNPESESGIWNLKQPHGIDGQRNDAEFFFDDSVEHIRPRAVQHVAEARVGLREKDRLV